MMILSQRVAQMKTAASIVQGQRARELKAQGVEIINLAQGEPDFPTPPSIVEAAFAAVRKGMTHYTDSRGIAPLRQAIAKKLEIENGVGYDPDREIVVTPGSKAAIFYVLQALLNPGDEALILEPAWLSYVDCVTLAGGVPVAVPAFAGTGFKPAAKALLDRLTERSRVLIINNPANPTGALWNRQELEALAELAKERRLIVLADEIYEKIVFSDTAPISIASLPGMRERAVIVNGFSKTYAMTGWRIGYLAGPETIVAQCLKVHQHVSTCAPAMSQSGALEALAGGRLLWEPMLNEYRKRRDFFLKAFHGDGLMFCRPPLGSFYVFADISTWGLSSEEAARFCLEKAGIMVTPGAAYGRCGESYLRFCLTVDMPALKQAYENLSRALGALNKANCNGVHL